jgi:membrane-bound lytic murein transglycosylase D
MSGTCRGVTKAPNVRAMNSVGSRWPLLVYAFIVWTVFGSESTFPAIELSIGKRAPIVAAPVATTAVAGVPSSRDSAVPPPAAPAATSPAPALPSAAPLPTDVVPPARDSEALRDLEDTLLRDVRGTSPPTVVPRPAAASPKTCQPRSSDGWVSRDWTRRFEDGWPRGMQYPQLPVSDDPRLARYIGYFTSNPEGRKTFTTWLRRSGKYREVFAGILQRRNLPLDLIAVAFVESGLWPTAVSKAGATGLWQFMPETARAYGLHVHDAFDERRSIWRSTEAAADHLRDLFEQVGSWELSLAAYNAGYPRVSRALEGAGTSDFWALTRVSGRLPRETVLYVPKVLAVSVILNNLSYFGFDEVVPLPPLDAEAIQVPPAVSLSDIARAAGTTVQFLRELNPQLTGESTPDLVGDIDVYVPRDVADSSPRAVGWSASRGVPRRLDPTLTWLGQLPAPALQAPTGAELLRGLLPTPTKRARLDLRGDEAVNSDSLPVETGALGWAGWVRGSSASGARPVWRIANGKLSLDRGKSATVDAPPSSDALSTTPAVIQYRVLLGDTLWSIARTHGTSERRIARDNRISESSILSEGRLLTVRSAKTFL